MDPNGQAERIEETQDEPKEEGFTVDLDQEAEADNEKRETPDESRDRRSSYKRLRDHADSLATRVKDFETKWEQTQRELTELRSRPQQVVQQPAQQQGGSEYDRQWGWYQEQMDTILVNLERAPQGTPQAELATQRNRYHQLQREQRQLEYQAFTQQNQPRQQGPAPEVLLLRSQFPQFYANTPDGRKLNREARMEAEELSEKYNRPVDYAIAVEANQRVVARRGKPAAPNPADRAKYTGTPGKAGSSGGQGNVVVLSDKDKKDALAYYNDTPHSNKPPEEQWRMYAKKKAAAMAAARDEK